MVSSLLPPCVLASTEHQLFSSSALALAYLVGISELEKNTCIAISSLRQRSGVSAVWAMFAVFSHQWFC